MRAKAFEKFLKAVQVLTPVQKERVQEALQETSQESQICQLLNEEKSKPSCPHCASDQLQKWGIVHQLQRYRCKACRKTFNRLSKTPFSRLRMKQKWQSAVESLNQGETVRKMAEHLKVNRKTAFRWRHRFLEGFSNQIQDKLGGIVEADETFFHQSEKGSRKLLRKARKRGESATTAGQNLEAFATVWIARDRQKTTFHQVTHHRDAYFVRQLLEGRIEPDSILCTDGKKGYAKFAKKQKIQHVVLNQSKKERVKDSVYHIQNVNNYQSRLKKWMGRFNGVATHYLHNYLQWFKLVAESSGNLFRLEPQNLVKIAILNT